MRDRGFYKISQKAIRKTCFSIKWNLFQKLGKYDNINYEYIKVWNLEGPVKYIYHHLMLLNIIQNNNGCCDETSLKFMQLDIDFHRFFYKRMSSYASVWSKVKEMKSQPKTQSTKKLKLGGRVQLDGTIFAFLEAEATRDLPKGNS